MVESTYEWISSREAAALLGIKQTNFFYYVKTGDIQAIETGKERAYNRGDVIKLRAKLARKAKAKKPVPLTPLIDWLKPADVPAGLQLDHAIYGEEVDLAEAAVYQGWRKHNNQLTMAAFSQDRSECWAYVQFVPLNEQVILDILRGVRSETSITGDEVLTYDEPGGYTLLAASAAARPDRRDLLYKVLYRYMDFWLNMYPDRYIRKIYAQVVSETGDRMAQHFFMPPRYDLARNAYELDLSRPGAAKMIRWFQARLKEKAPLPADLLPDYRIPRPVASTAQIQEHTKPIPTPSTNYHKHNLPDGLKGFTDLYRAHQISESTARRGMNEGRFTVVNGDWANGVRQALDHEGQSQFVDYFRSKGRLQICNDSDCPCHEM